MIKLASLTDRVLEGGGCPGQPPEPLPPKRQAVVERLRRRIEGYRRHQNNCMPRFDHSFNGVVEQNLQDTLLLKQRFLENKPKRPVKKSEKKPAESSIQNNISLPKFPKCSAPEETSENFSDSSKPQLKHENMTKFSVEIVQQLEFTATSTNSQISTNVTVKALNTSSVKGDVPNSPQSPRNINIIECKQEPENIDFVDLEQCAAALEKDANGGNSFPGLSDLIGDDNADPISSDTFKDLISEISEYTPELMMKEFDFNSGDKIKDEPKLDSLIKTQPISCANVQQTVINQQQRLCASTIDMPKPELSPAAQTLKNMAEQHQHKAQMGIGFTRINQKPYEFQYTGTTEFVNQSVNPSNFKLSPSYPSDGIKQESFSAQNSPVGYANSPSGKTPSPQRMATQYKQQVYQYGGQISPQYRTQQPIKIDYSKNQVSHQPMITFSQAGMLQPIPPSGPMLRAPQPQYLPPRYNLPMPRASYTKAPRLPQQEPTWMIQRPQQEFLQEAHINQLQMSRVQQQIQMNQVRVHQSVSALSRTTNVPFSTSYTNANASYAQSNFNMQQTFGQQNIIAPEFSLDFLEQLPHSDVSNFSDQELLFSSLESGTNFNFPDIL